MEAYERLPWYMKGVIPDWNRPCTYVIPEGDDLSWDIEALDRQLREEGLEGTWAEGKQPNERLPEGTYTVRIAGIRSGACRDGSFRVTFEVVVLEGPWARRHDWYDQPAGNQTGMRILAEALRQLELDCLAGHSLIELTPEELRTLLPAAEKEAAGRRYLATKHLRGGKWTCYQLEPL